MFRLLATVVQVIVDGFVVLLKRWVVVMIMLICTHIHSRAILHHSRVLAATYTTLFAPKCSNATVYCKGKWKNIN